MSTDEVERSRTSETTLQCTAGLVPSSDVDHAIQRATEALALDCRSSYAPAKDPMSNFRKQSAAAMRFAERRQREDEAPRLSTSIPQLQKLCFAIEERSDANRASGPKHVRHIVVANAPALFFVPCGDPRCVDGGHDVTAPIMQALISGQTTFHGQDTCYGSLGPSQCARVLHYDATAEYGT